MEQTQQTIELSNEDKKVMELMERLEKDNAKLTSIRTSLAVGGGGYGFKGPNVFGHCDYCTPKYICKIAEKFNLPVHLAGDWSIVGKKGYGELVEVFELKDLLLKWVNTHPNGKWLKHNYI